MPYLLLGTFLIPALILIPAFVVIFRACTLPRSIRRAAAHPELPPASCGRCGCAYTAWTRCPKCGAEIVQAGILTPELAFRSRPGLLLASLAWLLIIAFFVPSLGMISYAWLDTRSSGPDRSLTEFRPIYDRAVSAPNLAIIAYTSGPDNNSFAAPSTATNLIVTDSTQSPFFHGKMYRREPISPSGFAHARIDSPGGRFVIVDKQDVVIRAGSTLTRDDASALFSAAGIDPAEAVLSRVLDDMVVLGERASTQPHSIQTLTVVSPDLKEIATGGGFSNSMRTLPLQPFGIPSEILWTLICVIIAAATLTLGILLMLRRRRVLLGRLA